MDRNSVPVSPIEFINIQQYNPLISKCEIKVCWVGKDPNRNKSIITENTARQLANTIPGSPIVGYYNEEIQDFEGHNKIIEVKDGKFRLKSATRPYGFVDLNARVWFQNFFEDGVQRKYLMTEGWLWTKQYPECQRVIDKGNNQSMELDNDLIDAYWTKDDNGKKQFFIINEAVMSKLCILGENVEPAFETASVTAPKTEFSFDEDFKNTMYSMMEELKTILNKGGNTKMEENTNIQNEEFAKAPEENKKDVCPDCGKPVDECTCESKKDPTENACGEGASKKDEDEEEKAKKYELNDIPEYVELNTKFEALQNDYSALQATCEELKGSIETLKATNEELTSANADLTNFKHNAEKAQKEELVNSFYMLSDEDKKDVVENIDTYSLEDIEAKLSVICVRNRVSFADSDDKTEPVTYHFNGEDNHSSGVNAPSWLDSAINVCSNM